MKSEPIFCTCHFKREDTPFEHPIVPEKQLVCFNWDMTLISTDSYREIRSRNITPQKLTEGIIVNDILPEECKINFNYRHDHVIDFIKIFYSSDGVFTDSDKIKELISELLNRGVNIAIVSYNEFPDLIKAGLEKAGLDTNLTGKINIICGSPAAEENLTGKMKHIAKAKELSNAAIKNENIILIDSDPDSIKIAKDKGIITFHKKDGEDICQIIEKVKDIVAAKEEGSFKEKFEDIYNELINQNHSNEVSPCSSDVSPVNSGCLVQKDFEEEYDSLVHNWQGTELPGNITETGSDLSL